VPSIDTCNGPCGTKAGWMTGNVTARRLTVGRFGETIAKAATRCGVDYTTAFRWRHRFLEALNRDKPTRLCGIVEADETFVLESFKGKRRGLPRAARKRGGKASKRGLSAEQIPVLVARDRTGATIDAVLPRRDAASIREIGTALQCAHAIEAGWVQVNQGSGQVPGHSYGGVKQSGIGREFSLQGMLDSFTQTKSVTINLDVPERR